MSQGRGSLTAVGLGICAPAQTTLETKSTIEHAEKVFSLVADPLSEYWLRTLNPNTESLSAYYEVGKDRQKTYDEMVERVVDAVRSGLRVCAAAYGHPGVAAYPLHESVRRLHAEGYDARMLAGVSTEDCLFADLGIDPGVVGCRSYEAADFLGYRREMDASSYLILWQVGAIAEPGHKLQRSAWNPQGIVVLMERLLEVYVSDHEAIVYEAAQIPGGQARIERIELGTLAQAAVPVMSTLIVPPMVDATADLDMLQRLGIDLSETSATALPT
ncbi:MAG: hypothetical protein JOZ01_06505 [Candidatus Eremiobacteraeota bacterium]|nr:hypothetical protein [Candidatus Eremiobacteraeota bacterium]